MDTKRIAHILSDAIAYRRDLLQLGDACVRVVAGAADDAPGLVVDCFGQLVVCSDYNPAGPGETLMAALEAALPGRSILLRWRGAEGELTLRLRWGGIPTPERIVAVEDGLRFEIGTDPRHDFGLFLDGRSARSSVRMLANGGLVLNLFCYACGFGVAARAGGARDVVNVDPERSYLSWGRRNAALNGTDFRVVPDTAQAFLRRWRRRAERGTAEHFDLVVADPPAFGGPSFWNPSPRWRPRTRCCSVTTRPIAGMKISSPPCRRPWLMPTRSPSCPTVRRSWAATPPAATPGTSRHACFMHGGNRTVGDCVFQPEMGWPHQCFVDRFMCTCGSCAASVS